MKSSSKPESVLVLNGKKAKDMDLSEVKHLLKLLIDQENDPSVIQEAFGTIIKHHGKAELVEGSHKLSEVGEDLFREGLMMKYTMNLNFGCCTCDTGTSNCFSQSCTVDQSVDQ